MLNKRTFYKVKKPSRSFLCALCSAPREMKYQKNLSGMKYLQIAILWGALSWALFPIFSTEVVFSVFIIWPAFEMVNKFLYRKDIACPYCGFDATWYRRDIKMAKKKVEDFWQSNYPELVGGPSELLEKKIDTEAVQQDVQ